MSTLSDVAIIKSMNNSENSRFVHHLCWGALCGLNGDFAVINCTEGLHDILNVRFIRRTDRIHVVGTLAECQDYIRRDRACPVSTLSLNLEQYV